MKEPITAIVLKGIPLGEADKLVTLLSQEWGVVRAVAKGARKTPSYWAGRTELFMTGQWRLAAGRWSHPQPGSDKLYRLTEMQISHAFRGLSRQLERLLAAQYLAEVALIFAPVGHPQPELYLLLLEHLQRLETSPLDQVLAYLCHGLYHCLACAGLAPQVFYCQDCRCHPPTTSPEIGFSLPAGGILCPSCSPAHPGLAWLSQPVWQALQHLPQPTLAPTGIPAGVWLRVERVLRRVIEFHSERTVQSAGLLWQLSFKPDPPVADLDPTFSSPVPHLGPGVTPAAQKSAALVFGDCPNSSTPPTGETPDLPPP